MAMGVPSTKGAARAFGDLETYPPIAARISELKAEQKARAYTHGFAL